MSNPVPWFRWRPSPASLVGGALFVAGLFLTDLSWWFLTLAGVGIFGPGILREFGWLRDQDEFQRRAAHRAGYHAFVVTGVAAFVLYAYTRAGGDFRLPTELSLVYLALLCFTWMFSSLFSYWGPHRTAFRILLIFGCAWGIFNVLGNLNHPVALLMQLLITTVPFFLLAYLSRRWPRAAGLLLTALSLFFLTYYFLPGHFSRLAFLVKLSTVVLFIGPLIASGVALFQPREPQSAGEADRPAGDRGPANTAEAR
jgi:hypothetical protein